MSTAHISAEKGDFGKTVLMPGDPLRAKFIAETFLEDAVLVNNVRGIQGYTGTYKGTKVSVMASGMGMPSMGIYSYELFAFYDVENIIRIGSSGSFVEKLKVRDIFAAMGACTDSNFAAQYDLPGTFACIADFDLLSTAKEASSELGLDLQVGNILSSDVFYNDNQEKVMNWVKMGVSCVEMEAAALYLNAARLGKRALTLVTISDHFITKEETTPEERQTSFTQMMEIALNTAVKMESK
ncbi:purine-nucleoside phosphorylase [Chakrabartyella piscis]|uniref:purine-nucleoside phosphorylase n=1 Tax=Chakrabartyella piscis TaxID=2918914 RepID=UPI002958D42A|nr:purine-nucleoside phosphorylase [Chakrabartyella piscis]